MLVWQLISPWKPIQTRQLLSANFYQHPHNQQTRALSSCNRLGFQLCIRKSPHLILRLCEKEFYPKMYILISRSHSLRGNWLTFVCKKYPGINGARYIISWARLWTMHTKNDRQTRNINSYKTSSLDTLIGTINTQVFHKSRENVYRASVKVSSTCILYRSLPLSQGTCWYWSVNEGSVDSICMHANDNGHRICSMPSIG